MTTGAPDYSDWTVGDLDELRLPLQPDWRPAAKGDAGWRLLVHDDVVEFLTDTSTDPGRRKRVYFCLGELLVRGRCGRSKPVQGPGKGWFRTQLAGTGGSHYYLWWAAKGSPAVDGAGLDDHEILVRAVRHHNDTSLALDAGTRHHRQPFNADDVSQPSGDSPFRPEQMAIATGPAPVSFVQGTPGSGKTTALWLAGSYSYGTKALYLTYSRGLARAAEEHFRVFRPEGTAVDVLTFEELLTGLADVDPGSIDFLAPTAGAERLRDHLDGFHQPLGPWADRWDELYAEIHAHAVGSALHIPFRGRSAAGAPVLPLEDYLPDRTEAIGGKAAAISGAVAHHLLERDLVESLFPGPAHARALTLRPTEPPPPRYEDVTALIVDEIQDLTPVEAMLLVTLAGRIGTASGTMPSLLIAGDEAQTVRPTAFRWSWLGDLLEILLGPRLGDRTEHNLTTNLRSPRLLASVIESTRSQYLRFDKGQRPANMTEVVADESIPGRAIYCRAPDDEAWAKVGRFFTDRPDAQLVFPGFRVPEDHSGAEVATPDQVKGLDYPLVGIVDAGRRERELIELGDQAETDPIVGHWGRTLADQFRVAVSRATETLVLLDRGEDDLVGIVRELIGPDGSDALEEIDADELSATLSDDETDPNEQLLAQIDESGRILDDDPQRAVRQMRNALRLVEPARASEGFDPGLEAEAHRLLGAAAAMAAARATPDAEPKIVEQYRTEAVRWLGAVGLGELYGALAAVDQSVLDRPTTARSARIVRTAIAGYGQILLDLSELEGVLRGTLRRWADLVLASELNAGGDEPIAVVDALDDLVATFEERHPELLTERDAWVRTQAERMIEAGEFDLALDLNKRARPPDIAVEARCLQGLGRSTEAVELYEEAGMDDEALSSARAIPDFERAIRLADPAQPGVVDRLQWAMELMAMLDPDQLAVGEPLTEEEHAALLAHVQSALDSARAAVPGEARATVTVLEAETDTSDDSAPAAEGGNEPEDEAEDDEVAQPTTVRSSDPLTDTAVVKVSDLAAELGISVGECLGLCSKLGIPARDGSSVMPETMGGRVRRRAIRENLATD